MLQLSGLFAIFHDDNGKYFQINLLTPIKPVISLVKLGLDIHDSVESVKENTQMLSGGKQWYSNIV